MSRQDRRAAASRSRKLASNASPEEILPQKHGPVQTGLVDIMRTALDALREVLGPNYHVTLFVAEREPSLGAELPRFNYMSTGERADMTAVLKAFVAKQEAIGADLDKINETPPTESRQ